MDQQDQRVDLVAGTAQRRRDTTPPRPSFVEYLKEVADATVPAHDRLCLQDAVFARTILISTLDITTTESQISVDNVRGLIESGHGAVQKFLSTWNSQQWLDSGRSGIETSSQPPAPIPA